MLPADLGAMSLWLSLFCLCIYWQFSRLYLSKNIVCIWTIYSYSFLHRLTLELVTLMAAGLLFAQSYKFSLHVCVCLCVCEHMCMSTHAEEWTQDCGKHMLCHWSMLPAPQHWEACFWIVTVPWCYELRASGPIVYLEVYLHVSFQSYDLLIQCLLCHRRKKKWPISSWSFLRLLTEPFWKSWGTASPRICYQEQLPFVLLTKPCFAFVRRRLNSKVSYYFLPGKAILHMKIHRFKRGYNWIQSWSSIFLQNYPPRIQTKAVKELHL